MEKSVILRYVDNCYEFYTLEYIVAFRFNFEL